MSYAEVAASGPQQSPEEPKPVPSVSVDGSEAASLIDIDSPHVNSVKSDFQEQVTKAETQAEQLVHEGEDKAKAEAHKVADAVESGEKKVASKVQQAKKALKEDGKKLSKNKDNPVLIGNAVIWGIATVAIGYGAYRKHSEGKLDWKLAGAVTGIIGGFSVVDYFGSKWLFENKFPLK